MFGLIREPISQHYAETLIYEYGSVRQEQLERILNNEGFRSNKVKSYINNIRSFSNKVFYDRKTRTFHSSSYEEPPADRQIAMEKCLWVLIDFLAKVEHHFPISSAFSPSQICLMLEERSYEIAYCPAGMETYFANQLRAARMELLYRAESSYFTPIVEENDKAAIEAIKYIVVIDNIDMAQYVNSKQIAYFVTLDKDNNCTFYTNGTNN